MKRWELHSITRLAASPSRNQPTDIAEESSNEQAFLHEKKRITDKTWVEWEDGITTNMKLPAFKEVWAEIGTKSPKSFKELRRIIG